MAEKPKQYVYILAILAGGAIIISPHYGPEPFAAFLLFASVSFLLGFIWPNDGWRWGIIVLLPSMVISWLKVVNAGSPMILFNDAFPVGGALLCACAGGYLGARISFRKEVVPTRTWRDSRTSTEQYIHVLAIITGGIIILTPRLGPEVISAFLIYSILAALFGFIWPRAGWQWGLWISLPLFLLTGYKMILAKGIAPLLSDAPTLAQVIASASVGAFAGAKLSFRKAADNPSVFYMQNQEGTSQFVSYSLAVVAGAAAIFLPRFGTEALGGLIIYAALATLLGFIWPREGWQWGLWLSLPLLVASSYKAIMGGGVSPFTGEAQLIALTLPASGIGGFIGSRLSFRRAKPAEQERFTLDLHEQAYNPRETAAASNNGRKPEQRAEKLSEKASGFEPSAVKINNTHKQKGRTIMEIRQQIENTIREKEREIQEHEHKIKEAIVYISALNDVLAALPAGEEAKRRAEEEEAASAAATV